MEVARLLYYSENRIDPSCGGAIRQLSQILNVSNHNNRAHGLTGAFVAADDWFVQVIEGDKDSVLRTFQRIKRDTRHGNVEPVEMAVARHRIFADWSLGLARRNDYNAHLFTPHLHAGRLQPGKMTADEMFDLLIGLSKLGLSRQLAHGELEPLAGVEV